jgi:hypothetical protein
MAAPAVAGVAALLEYQLSDTNGNGHLNDEVLARLTSTADPIPGTGSQWRYGAINAAQAVTNTPPPSYRAIVKESLGGVLYWRFNESSELAPVNDDIGGHSGRYQTNGMITGPAFNFGVEGGPKSDGDPAVELNKGSSLDAHTGGSITYQGNINTAPELLFADQFTIELSFKLQEYVEGGDWSSWAYLVHVDGARARVMVSPEPGVPFSPDQPIRAFVALEYTGWTGDPSRIVVRATEPIRDAKWHHLVITKNGVDARVFVDGRDVSAPVSTATMSGGTVSSVHVAQPCIGTACTIGGIRGIDELLLYNRALTPSETAQHYNAARLTGRG